MKNKLYVFGICIFPLISLLNVQGAISDYTWNFDRFKDEISQGWGFEGFNRVAPDPAMGVINLEYRGKPGAKGFAQNVPVPVIFNGSWYKGIAPAKAYVGVEVKMSAELQPVTGPAIAYLCVTWRRDGNKQEGIVKQAIIFDGKMHTYYFNLEKSPEWQGENDRVGRLSLKFENLPDNKLSSFKLDRIRYVPSESFECNERFSVAEVRINNLLARVAGLEKRGIKCPVSALSSLQETLKEVGALKDKSPAAAMRRLDELEKVYAEAYSRAALATRLEILYESLNAMTKTLKFRAKKDVRIDNFREDIKRIKQLIETANFVKVNQLVDQAEIENRKIWDSLLQVSDWQAGISDYSYGRFGWTITKFSGIIAHGNGRDSISRIGFYYYPDQSTSILRFYPGEATLTDADPIVNSISWVSSDITYQYRNKNNKNIKWRLINSLLAPGFIIDTDAKSVRFSLSPKDRHCPARIVVPTSDGVKLFSLTEVPLKIKMTENWILMLSENGYAELPWILTFQHQPVSFSNSGDSLQITFREPVMIGAASPFGVKAMPKDFSKNWTKVPGDIISQCRKVAGIMNMYPVECQEYFRVCKESDEIEITSEVSYVEVKNDWNTPGQKVSPLPPLVALAEENGYPLKLKDVQDFDLPTIFGPYKAAKGDKLTYRLPLPDLRSVTYPKTDAYKQYYSDYSNGKYRNVNDFFGCQSLLMPEYSVRVPASNDTVYPAWCYADVKHQNCLAENGRAGFEDHFKRFAMLGSFNEAGDVNWLEERTEPLSGLPALMYGWSVIKDGIGRVKGDMTNHAGWQLHAMMLYAKFTGDWQFVKEYYRNMLRIFEAQRRRWDWATGGQSCQEDYFIHLWDMGPDSWVGLLGMHKMALFMEDRRTADLTSYLLAKQALTLVSAFYGRAWSTLYNTRWEHKGEGQIPEAGWTESGYITGSWEKDRLNSTFIYGIAYAPQLLTLYRQFCPVAATDFEYNVLEQHCPQWRNPRILQNNTKIAPYRQMRHWMLREKLGETSEALEPVVAAMMSGEKDGTLPAYMEMGAYWEVKFIAVSTLSGRQSPYYLDDWSPARLLGADYSTQLRKAHLTFTTTEPFVVKLVSQIRPDKILLNGNELPESQAAFDPKSKSLEIRVAATGRITLDLDYASFEGWERVSPTIKYPMKKHQKQGGGKVSIERDAENDFQCSDPVALDLSKYYSMQAQGINPGTYNIRGIDFKLGNQKKNVVGLIPGKQWSVPVNRRFKRMFFVYKGGDKNSSGALTISVRYADGKQENKQVKVNGDKLAVADIVNDHYAQIAVPDATIMQRPVLEIASFTLTGKVSVDVLAVVGDLSVGP